jgi:DTW domain-containing protein YfiP
MTQSESAQPLEIHECPRCGKPEPLCICDSVAPLENRLALVILQHPQEQDRALGTARLTALHFKNALVKVGLSWPSLQKIVGRDVDPQRWAILYLGSARAADLGDDRDIIVVDRKGGAEEGQSGILKSIEGVVVLDGTWSQAKALWWRNPWMLKCRRVILGPAQASRYGNLRREPRSDGLSTLEAAGMLMARLEKRPDIEAALLASFDRMLKRYRTVQAELPELAPRPKKRDWRRKRK